MEKIVRIEDYISKHHNWSKSLQLLCDLCETEGLKGAIKWGCPTYTYLNKNVIGIVAFKHHIALWFHNGVFLKDEKKHLINVNEGKTKGLYQWRFKSYEEIDPTLVRHYIKEAVINEKEGKRIKLERNKPLTLPEELSDELNKNPALTKAFANLTKSKQREFAEYIATAKRQETRLSRLNKCLELILLGIGLNDKYRK